MAQKDKLIFLHKEEVLAKNSPSKISPNSQTKIKLEEEKEERATEKKESPSTTPRNTLPKESHLPLAEIGKDDLLGLSEGGQEILKMSKDLKKESTEEALETKNPKPISARPNQSALEEQLSHERINSRAVTSPINSDYAQHLAQEPMVKIYHEMTSLYELAGEKGYLNPDEQRRVQYLASAVEQKVQDAEEHRYTMTEEAAAVAGITRQIGSKLQSLYKGNSADYRPTYS